MGFETKCKGDHNNDIRGWADKLLSYLLDRVGFKSPFIMYKVFTLYDFKSIVQWLQRGHWKSCSLNVSKRWYWTLKSYTDYDSYVNESTCNGWILVLPFSLL